MTAYFEVQGVQYFHTCSCRVLGLKFLWDFRSASFFSNNFLYRKMEKGDLDAQSKLLRHKILVNSLKTFSPLEPKVS